MDGKKIIITESQRERLFEAAWPWFNMDVLEKAEGNRRYFYAVKMLGEPFAIGSSRAVFDINDEYVLKLALNLSNDTGVTNDIVGCEQNKTEAELFMRSKSKILPRITYASNDFSFMICERAVQAKAVDFEKYIGLPFDYEYVQNTSPYEDDEGSNVPIGYDKYFGKDLKSLRERPKVSFHDVAYYIEDIYILDNDEVDDEMEALIDSNWWLKELRNLAAKYEVSDFDSISNFGIVKRDGEEMIVLLDSGMNYDINEKYYE